MVSLVDSETAEPNVAAVDPQAREARPRLRGGKKSERRREKKKKPPKDTIAKDGRDGKKQCLLRHMETGKPYMY